VAGSPGGGRHRVRLVTATEERHWVPVAGGRLAMVLHLPGSASPAPVVVACHGLSASKDSDKYLLLGAEFARAGLALARFDFRGCGESTGVESETTVATRLADARAVLARLGAHSRLRPGPGLLGSSMGGVVALHLAAELEEPAPVVTWNAPADFRELRPVPARNGVGIGPSFIAEVRAGRYVETPSGIPRHLVVQSDADDVVPVEHGRRLHGRAAEPRALEIISGADHRLSDPAHRRRAVAASLAWFCRHLRGEAQG
jgi:alpha-beta hydrolase superfamily lysophospholipase